LITEIDRRAEQDRLVTGAPRTRTAIIRDLLGLGLKHYEGLE